MKIDDCVYLKRNGTCGVAMYNEKANCPCADSQDFKTAEQWERVVFLNELYTEEVHELEKTYE